MKKNPSKESVDYFQLAHLIKYIDINKELNINKIISDKYNLGSIKKVSPYLVYKNNSYVIKYKIIEIGDEGMGDLSLEILIGQDDKIINNIIEELNDIFYNISSTHIDEKIIVSNSDKKKIINE